jgi:hypothetical protein
MLQMGFDWECFIEDTTILESHNELLSELQRDLQNQCIYTHIQAYSKLQQLNLEATKLLVESNNIQNDLTNTIEALQCVVT